jgi:hypothetical protein
VRSAIEFADLRCAPHLPPSTASTPISPSHGQAARALHLSPNLFTLAGTKVSEVVGGEEGGGEGSGIGHQVCRFMLRPTRPASHTLSRLPSFLPQVTIHTRPLYRSLHGSLGPL